MIYEGEITLNQHDSLLQRSKFADDMKLGEVTNAPGDCAAIQRDIDRMEKRVREEPPKTQQEIEASPAPTEK